MLQEMLKKKKQEEAKPQHNWSPGAEIPEDALRWGNYFEDSAKKQLANSQLRRNIRHATTAIRNKRQTRVDEMPDWEQLRLAASAVKQNTQENLPELLEEFGPRWQRSM